MDAEQLADKVYAMGHRCGYLDAISELTAIANENYVGDAGHEKWMFIYQLVKELRSRMDSAVAHGESTQQD